MNMKSELKHNRLGQTGIVASCLGFGTAQISRGVVFDENLNCVGGHEEVIKTIEKAIESGINYFDTSPLYGGGKSEAVLGQALEQFPRDSYYLATKVGRKPDCTFDYSKENAVNSVEMSLKKLRVQYLDVIQVHDCEFADSTDIILNETLPALEDLRRKGKVKYIGITGYPLTTLKEIIERSKTHIDLVLSYCRCTPFDRTLNQYLPFFHKMDVGVINGSVLGINLFTNNPLAYWHVAGDEIRRACQEASDYCKSRGVDITRMAIDYALKQNGIGTHLIGMEDTKMLEFNLDVATKGINDREQEVLNQVIDKIFNKVQHYHWEGVEVQKYRSDREGFSRYLRG